MKVMCILLMILSCTWVVAQQSQPAWPKEPDGYGAVKWGAKFKENKKVLHINDCILQNYGNLRTCPVDSKMGDLKISITYGFWKDNLVEVIIGFDPKNYQSIKSTLLEQYGEPIETKRNPFKYANGMEYPSEQLKWPGNFVTLELLQYRGTLTEGVAFFYENSWMQQQILTGAIKVGTAKTQKSLSKDTKEVRNGG